MGTPTKAVSAREKWNRVGVARRRNKAQRGGRRKQRRRPPGKSRTALAWPDGGIRRSGEGGANMTGCACLKTAARKVPPPFVQQSSSLLFQMEKN